MSRTHHKDRQAKRGWNREYWSARPGNEGGGETGRLWKRITHSIERLRGKEEVERELAEVKR